MKSTTDLYNESGLSNNSYDENGNCISVTISKPLMDVKHPNLVSFNKSDKYPQAFTHPFTDGERTLYRVSDDAIVSIIAFSKSPEFKYTLTKGGAQQYAAEMRGKPRVDEMRVFEMPYGIAKTFEKQLKKHKISEYGSYYSHVYDFVESGFDFDFAKKIQAQAEKEAAEKEAAEKEAKEAAEKITCFMEFRRGEGFFASDVDNHLIGTWGFETKAHRDEELQYCNEFYQEYKNIMETSNRYPEEIWNEVFTNGLEYDMV